MAKKEYRVEGFRGIDQSRSENQLPSGYSPDAQNMDTENGDLAVGKGFVKHIDVPVPGTGEIRRHYAWNTPDEDRQIVIAGNSIYYFNPVTEAWDTIYTYGETITSRAWDFEEIRIGTTDYLIIANAQTQLVKWSGTGAAELFGSGEYVYESTIASLTYNMSKATAATYAEASGVGTYTLTMPGGWAYSAGILVAFDVPSPVVSATSVKINIGGTNYTANYVPGWLSGEVAVVVLTTASACEISDTEYGIVTVTLSAAISETWKQRALDIGVRLNGVTYAVSAIDTARTVLTLKEPCAAALSAGQTAKVRGGVSDAAVGFIEIHFSKLFAAGDAEHPSRLYWSQPPGDTRTIEDWSSADASSDVSGGFVDVGNTSTDPICGLWSLSNQLLIFKKTSLYRLLGDRPSNFRIMAVNKGVEQMTNTGCVAYGDVPYWLTRAGMYYHNGQVAVLSGAARQIRSLLANADLGNCKACECRDRLYFTLKRGTGSYDDSIIVYDMTERTYMLRNGFNVVDICSREGTMYLINDKRYVYRWAEGTDYDGDEIEAYWRTPKTDLSLKRKKKTLTRMYLRGEGETAVFDVYVDKATQEVEQMMPDTTDEVVEIKLCNSGKTIGFKISNQAGNYFKLYGGVEILYDESED